MVKRFNFLTALAASILVGSCAVSIAWAQTVIVDNTDSEFNVLSASWSSGTSAPGHWATGYRFRDTTGSGAGVGAVEWRPNLPISDTYDVAVYYPQGANRADNATFTVHHNGGATPIIVSQQINGGTWRFLGSYSFNAGTAGSVELDNDANSGVVMADAVRFIAQSGPAPLFTEQGAAVLGGLRLDSRSVSAADIDNDGDYDLMFQGAGSAHLLRNNLVSMIGGGAANYTDISAALPAGLGPSWSTAWSDVDGDGDVDAFVGQSNIGGSGDYLRNDGVAGFANASVATGLDDPGFHQNVGWADMDGDLDLDLVMGMEGPEKHEIYLQGPPNSFTAVGAAANFQQDFGTKAYGMAMGDTDGDGDLDVYISTCRADNNIRNNFYENQLADTGTLGFVDIADANGTQFFQNSYGAEFFDFDDDGDLDLFMVGADGQLSKIFRNDGGNQFTDVDTITGHELLTSVGGDLNGGRTIDYDNDGDLDLFMHDHKQHNSEDHARKLYRNDGNWEFTDVTDAVGIASTNEGAYDSTWLDFDLDGDLDLFAPTDIGSPEKVFVSSASANGNHWLHVRLIGTSDNTRAVGARLDATIHSGTPMQRTLRRDANANAGTFNQSDLPVHFGLGDATVVDQLHVVWPDGQEQFLCNVGVDQHTTLHYPIAGDFDGDGAVADADVTAFVDCHGGPLSAIAPSDTDCVNACESAFDADDSGAIDLIDYQAFQESLADSP